MTDKNTDDSFDSFGNPGSFDDAQERRSRSPAVSFDDAQERRSRSPRSGPRSGAGGPAIGGGTKNDAGARKASKPIVGGSEGGVVRVGTSSAASSSAVPRSLKEPRVAAKSSSEVQHVPLRTVVTDPVPKKRPAGELLNETPLRKKAFSEQSPLRRDADHDTVPRGGDTAHNFLSAMLQEPGDISLPSSGKPSWTVLFTSDPGPRGPGGPPFPHGHVAVPPPTTVDPKTPSRRDPTSPVSRNHPLSDPLARLLIDHPALYKLQYDLLRYRRDNYWWYHGLTENPHATVERFSHYRPEAHTLDPNKKDARFVDLMRLPPAAIQKFLLLQVPQLAQELLTKMPFDMMGVRRPHSTSYPHHVEGHLREQPFPRVVGQNMSSVGRAVDDGAREDFCERATRHAEIDGYDVERSRARSFV